jgi:hypothetical protein
MTTSQPAKDPQQQQRRAVVRTALVLAAFAVTSYAMFLWTATRSAQ